MPRRRAPRAVAVHAARDRRSPGDRGESGLGGEQVEGRRAVRELLAVGRRAVHEVVIAEGQDASTLLDEVVALARAARVPAAVRVAALELRGLARSEAPQGVVARAAPVEPVGLDELVAGNPGTRAGAHPDGAVPFLVVVAEVTDPHNLGAVLRSALGAGATGVVLARSGRRTSRLRR